MENITSQKFEFNSQISVQGHLDWVIWMQLYRSHQLSARLSHDIISKRRMSIGCLIVFEIHST